MKKILLVLTLTLGTLVSNAQTDTTGFANKIVDLFKSQVVNVSFKDPYSFQLLSVGYNEVTIGNSLKVQIETDSLYQTPLYSFVSKKEKQQRFQSMNDGIEKLKNMSETEKNRITHYVVRIECRGSNSYGNLVYSKYVAEWHPETNTLGKYGFMNTSKR
jgi:hypothetical protein